MFRHRSRIRPTAFFLLIGSFALVLVSDSRAESRSAAVDLTEYRSDCGVEVKEGAGNSRLSVSWPINERERGRIDLDLSSDKNALVSAISLLGAGHREGEPQDQNPLLKNLEPTFWVTVGKRESPPDRPPSMSVFNVFFDSPAKRPHQTFRSRLNLQKVKVTSIPGRATIRLEKLEAGPFAGALELTIYSKVPLVHVAAAMKTDEDSRAFVYDAGLVASDSMPVRLGWRDTEGKTQALDVKPEDDDRSIAVRNRTLIAETGGGSVACFPPPHQYFYPRDLTDNQSTVWAGRSHRGSAENWGFGIRQTEKGGGNYVPWFNAPPETVQKMGVFFLLSRGKTEEALSQVLKFTRNDSYPEIPGHLAMTSHWHVEVAVAAMQEIARGKGRSIPDLVKMFKDMGVKIVHLAEFHGQGHPQGPEKVRIPELEAMFAECRRLSDDQILFLPGEEANVHLGAEGKEKHPGHWLYLFPKPVYWTMKRGKDEPFAETRPGLGTLYHVGNQAEMERLIREEHGLAWTAHPRIKASNWAPDEYRHEPFFRDRSFLGATWKAMPADLSIPRLGVRCLDLLDDMANWGDRKYAIGEVDVFKIDHTHELFGHMNVNYVRLPRLPRYDDDWSPILDALSHGRFFVTTGEVLIRDFQVGGKLSGESLIRPPNGKVEVKLDLDWTFPMHHVDLISGDGERIYRDRIMLDDTSSFGQRTITRSADLTGRKWIRAEAWDIATNGAFTQPVWFEAVSKSE
ncbi:hypothetical protein [Singulisphaera sp. PoT]|uniref:hypothetical protein n=1 Tax=Singulisphaera sp. PoT TaxID=3411797 RepID=UPI003BF5527C